MIYINLNELKDLANDSIASQVNRALIKDLSFTDNKEISVKEMEEAHYYSVTSDTGTVIGLCSYKKLTNRVALLDKFIIEEDNKGTRTVAYILLENIIRNNDYTKLVAESTTINLSKIIFLLKQNFLIEGLQRDYLGLGKDQYILGKDLIFSKIM